MTMKPSYFQRAAFNALLFFLSAVHSCGSIVHEIIDLGDAGKINVFHDDAVVANACETIVFIGVGTAMKVQNYQKLATAVVEGQPIIFIVADDNPRGLVKLSEIKFSALANAVLSDTSLPNLLPICQGAGPTLKLVGGHSASGQAAMNAFTSPSLYDFTVSGFVGLDPFDTSNVLVNLTVPSLFWGFAKVTCGVELSGAAKNGYLRDVEEGVNRVLYVVDNPKMYLQGQTTHCVFADRGCFGPVCPARPRDGPLRQSIGQSIQVFVQAILKGGTFQPSDFTGLPNLPTGSLLYVNSQTPITP